MNRVVGVAVLLIALSTSRATAVRAGSPDPIVPASVVPAPSTKSDIYVPPQTTAPLPAATLDPSQPPEQSPSGKRAVP